ncbi:unnamed protein product, partial [Brassica oleracea]
RVQLGFANTPLEAEAKGLLSVIQNICIRGLKSIIFEGDRTSSSCSDATPKDYYFQIATLCQDINEWAPRIEAVTFTHVSRNINKVAHVLAHVDANQWFLTGTYMDTPLCTLLEQDIVNISNS